MELIIRDVRLRWPRPCVVMGIVNVTPDSFSDGGKWFSCGQAVDHAMRLLDEGADWLDIGGESTRPGASPVSEEEEIRRVIPVIQKLAGQTKAPISVDTMKPGVAERALDAGASIVNDVGACRSDEALWRCVARFGAGYVAMHMRGMPGTMQDSPQYADVRKEVDEFLGAQLDRMGACGMAREQVILDPGIGFGKTPAHNLSLIAGLNRFLHWGRPLMLGLSRKSVVAVATGVQAVEDRVAGSLAGAVWGCIQGVQIIRTHDVAVTRRALRMTEAILGHVEETG